MSDLGTFTAVFMAVSLSKVAEILFNRYTKTPIEKFLDGFEKELENRYGLKPRSDNKSLDKPVDGSSLRLDNDYKL